MKAALSYIEEKGEEGDVTRIPVVTVTADGKEVAKLEGESTGFADPPVSVQIAEIDRSYRFGPPLYGLAFLLAFVNLTASLLTCLALAVFFSITGSRSRR